MRFRHVLNGASLAAVASLASAIGAAGEPAQNSRRPNILIFLADDLGYADMAFMGNKMVETPNLDEFSAQSTFFTNGYVAPESSPTRAGLMTGKNSARLHLTTWIPQPNSNKANVFNGLTMPEEARGVSASEYTLAEALSDNGYKTAHFGKWHIGEGKMAPRNQGFSSDTGYWPWSYPKSYFSPYGIPTLSDGPKGEYITDRLTDEVVKFIEENKDETFFVNFWHYAVHAPLKAKADLTRYYRGKGAPEEGKDHAVYSAMKHSLDESFGRVIAALKENGVYDNTVVIFLSDNGGVSKFADNGILREGKKTLYEGGVRTPILVHYPGAKTQGSRLDEPICYLDMYPTILDIAGVPSRSLPKNLDGVSIKGLFSGGKIHREDDAFFWHQMGAFYMGPASSIRQGDYKLIKYYGFSPVRFELYDLKNDPSEKENLAGKMPDKVKELDRLIRKYVTRTGAQMPSGEVLSAVPKHLKQYVPSVALLSQM